MQKQNEKQAQETGKRQANWLPFYISGGIILVLAGCYFLIPGVEAAGKEAWNIILSGDRNRLADWVEGLGWWGPLLIVLIMVLQMFLVVVNVVAVMLVAILAYGAIWGSVIAVVAVVIASSVGYYLGFTLGCVAVSRLIGSSTVNKVEAQVNRYGVWAVIIARISPFISNDAISFVAGLAGMGYPKFIMATLAGIVPLTVLLAWLGEDWERLKSGLIWISVISIAGLLVYYFYDRSRKRKK